MIFFDNGLAQYQEHKHIYLVVRQLKYVWNNVHPESREYIKYYLKSYPDRYMKRFIKDTTVQVLYEKYWLSAKVIEIDASVVKIFFLKLNRYEWLYRGSTKFKIDTDNHHHLQNFICFKNIELKNFIPNPKNVMHKSSIEKSKNVARKKTGNKNTVSVTTSRHIHATTSQETTTTTAIIKNNTTRSLSLPNETRNREQNYTHKCNRFCIETTGYDYKKTKMLNLLAVPLRFGYTRYVRSINKNLKTVIYETPCGRTINNISDMHNYLVSTESKMTVDQFYFDSILDPENEFKVIKPRMKISDISEGLEFKPITCVNNINCMTPYKLSYLISREPMSDVRLNVDGNFLCGCDCTDNCLDKLKCACWKMTRDAQHVLPNLYNNENIGYNYRRLSEGVVTGIYECNKLCKCSNSCLNRVVQHPITHRLQLYMTKKKGWGVRSLDDIPKGSFICSYIGQLLTEAKANHEGKILGDQYLADLDFIETVEQIKSDYESDVYMSDEENGSDSMNLSDCMFTNVSDSSDEEFVLSKNTSNKNNNKYDMINYIRYN